MEVRVRLGLGWSLRAPAADDNEGRLLGEDEEDDVDDASTRAHLRGNNDRDDQDTKLGTTVT